MVFWADKTPQGLMNNLSYISYYLKHKRESILSQKLKRENRAQCLRAAEKVRGDQCYKKFVPLGNPPPSFPGGMIFLGIKNSKISIMGLSLMVQNIIELHIASLI